MRVKLWCGLLAAGILIATGARAEAWGRCRTYYQPPQVIYIVPATGAYYYAPPAAAAPAQPAAQAQAAQPKNAQNQGAYYYNPGNPAQPAAPATSAPPARLFTPTYPPASSQPVEYDQPPGWWFR